MVAMLYNAHRDSKKDPKGINWLDVFPEHKPPMRPQTEEELFAVMQMWARATGSKPDQKPVRH